MEFPMSLSNLNQPKPPRPPRPQLSSILIYAIFGLLIGLVVQEFRWRGSIMVPQTQMAQAEKDVKAGDYKTAVTLFENSLTITMRSPNTGWRI